MHCARLRRTQLSVPPGRPQDQFFATHLPMLGAVRDGEAPRIADEEIARRFAVEGVLAPRPMAVHKPWAHLDPRQLRALRADCPEVDALMEGNGVRLNDESRR